MPSAVSDTDTVLPLHAESLSVQRRLVETGHIRVSTRTVSDDVTVRETLSQDHAEVERVAMGEFVADMPQIRQQGDVTIIPVVEEILFVEKRLFLKEEIRIRRTTTTQLHEQTVTLRREEAVIERDAANLASTPVAPDQGAPTPKESHHGQ